MNNILSQFDWKSQVKTSLSSVTNNFGYWDYVSGWENSLHECSDWSWSINWLQTSCLELQLKVDKNDSFHLYAKTPTAPLRWMIRPCASVTPSLLFNRWKKNERKNHVHPCFSKSSWTKRGASIILLLKSTLISFHQIRKSMSSVLVYLGSYNKNTI